VNLEEYQQMYELEDTHWYFIGKRLIIKSILERYLLPRKTCRILDIGCGTGKILEMLQRFGDVSGADTSIAALEFCRKRGMDNLCYLSMEGCLPFLDSSFDFVTAFDVLEHVNDDRGMIREIRRVCNPGGKLLITVPAFMFLWSPHDNAVQHRRRYTKKQVEELLKLEGLTILQASYTNFFLFPIAVAVRWFRTAFHRKRGSSEFFIQIPDIVNRLFLFVLRLEAAMIQKISFPFGVSIVCLAEKPDGNESSRGRVA